MNSPWCSWCLGGESVTPLRIILCLALYFLTLPLAAWSVTERQAPELAPLWQKLDDARTAYRGNDFPVGKTYAQSVASWDSEIIDPSYGQSPKEIFTELALGETGFRQYLDNSTLAEEAAAGVREALNELMAGQALVGNDYLIRGLRARFPGAVSNDDSARPVELLEDSVGSFQDGIDRTVEELRVRPFGLRSRKQLGDNVSFDELVENTPVEGEAQGDAVFNEFYRFTHLAYRQGLASNSLGRRKFFYENTSPEGREDAARTLKRSAQATYLNTALLTALQNRDDFHRNKGYELKRQVLEAQRTFDDINAGFNPLKLLGDFVPRQPVESFIRLFNGLVETAVRDEAGYKAELRDYDVNQTTLANELAEQQQRYLDTMEALTGIPSGVITTTYGGLLESAHREAFLNAAERSERDASNAGQLRRARLAIDQAVADARLVFEQVRQIPERIRTEERRSSSIATLIIGNGNRLALLDYAIGHANAWQMGFEGPEFNPAQVIAGQLRSNQTLIQATQSARIEGINSAAQVKSLLLEQATALISLDRARVAIDALKAESNALRAELQRVVRNYVTAQRNLAEAYYADPAYRLETDIAKENAESSFEAAMIQGYFTAKALEYEWAESFSNPVERIGVGNPVPIGEAQLFAPFIAAESVFSCRSAGNASSPAPRLSDFLTALEAWDQTMRQVRGNEQQPQFVEIISLRKDILGFAGGDESTNRLLFADFLAKNRKPGRNPRKDDLVIPFALSIADQRLFPAEPNLKLVDMSLNIKSRPPRFAAEAGWSRPFRVEMVMLDEAVIRTFWADFSNDPPDDDLLIIDLEEGRTLSTSPFRGLLQATLDGQPSGLPANVQFANLSPAVTRWVLRIDMANGENVYLIPEYIDDIEIRMTYKFGRPEVFTF